MFSPARLHGSSVEAGMSPRFTQSGQYVRHALEEKFNASAWDILCAIERGFRAQVDVKGKLAEWFLYRRLAVDWGTDLFHSVLWSDEDGKPDFRLLGCGVDLTMECKNLRSEEQYADGSFKLETQKTRNQKEPPVGPGEPARKGTRWYRVTEFDIVAACLFNQTGRWDYYYARAVDLERHPEDGDYLKPMQKVPPVPMGAWKATLQEVLAPYIERNS